MRRQSILLTPRRYWLNLFALYALVEAGIQLIFFIILNNFGQKQISLIEIHFIMWVFQCLLIWPIWWVAWLVRKKGIALQILVNLAFYIGYSYIWFGPVQNVIGWLYNHLLQFTRLPGNRLPAILDTGSEYSYLNYQLLKHAFRLSWFYLAAYFLRYRQEEKKRLELAVANRALQLKMLKWHLNPEFYFKTINHLRELAAANPSGAAAPILQLARVMEYVIYEAKEKWIDVKKETRFLSDYIRLRNQQTANPVHMEMDITDDPGQLKIAPLLLTGIIDKVSDQHAGAGTASYTLNLQFSGDVLHLVITGPFAGSATGWLPPDDPLLLRLNELYPAKHSFNYSPGDKTLKLDIKLDAER